MGENTRFRELLKAFPRSAFNRHVGLLASDKHSKGFKSWDQLVTMIYAQLSGARSLRELEADFNQYATKFYHLGTRDVRRSTLSDANAKRDSALFEQVCLSMLGSVNRRVRKQIKDKLYFLDSSPIPLSGRGFEWAQEKHNHRTKGLKVHMMIEACDQLPVFANITPANVNDVTVGNTIEPISGVTYVFDKGYCDYNMWFKLHKADSHFVTRLKKNAGVVTVKQHRVNEEVNPNIIEDKSVEFKNKRSSSARPENPYYGTPLRVVVVHREDKDTPITLVTNDFKRTAQQIADLYKQRWDIELFFKWLKQNLKIKQFLGRTENAVRTQIFIAIITYILASIYRENSGYKKPLKLLLAGLKTTLFLPSAVLKNSRIGTRYTPKVPPAAQGALDL